MDPAILPREPIIKQSGDRQICYFLKADWSRPEVQAFLDSRWPDHVQATWFDSSDTHKVNDKQVRKIVALLNDNPDTKADSNHYWAEVDGRIYIAYTD